MAKKYLNNSGLFVARRKIIYFATTTLGLNKNGLKISHAVQAYKDYFKITSVKSKDQFLIEQNESGPLSKVVIVKKPRVSLYVKKELKRNKIKEAKFPKITDRERKSYNWFLKGKYWRKVREIVIKRDLGKCILCRTDKNLHVHHMTYKNHFNEHNHLDDLITLCKTCHENEHKKKDSKLIIK